MNVLISKQQLSNYKAKTERMLMTIKNKSFMEPILLSVKLCKLSTHNELINKVIKTKDLMNEFLQKPTDF